MTPPQFTWDEGKAASNLTKHGVSFDRIAAFAFETALTVQDTRLNYGETRWRSLGNIDGRVHAAVYAWRGGAIRLISLRKANAREVQHYEQYRRSRSA